MKAELVGTLIALWISSMIITGTVAYCIGQDDQSAECRLIVQQWADIQMHRKDTK